MASAEERPHFLGAGAFVLDCGCGASVSGFFIFLCLMLLDLLVFRV